MAGIVAGLRWLPRGGASGGPLTYPVARGELVITVTERGELESSNTQWMKCEVEGGQLKLASIVPEGTHVSKGQEVCRFDTDAIQKSLSEQEVKWKQAEGKARTAKSELEVAQNKAGSEVDKGELALTLAKLDRDKYLNAEYKADEDEKSGALELARKDQKEAEDNLDFNRNLVKKGFMPLETVRAKEMELQQKKHYVSRDETRLKLLKDYERRRKMTELEGKAREAERELERTRKSQKAAVEKAKDELESATVTATLEKSQVERLKKQFDRCVVLAPQDGIVVYFKDRWDDSSRIQPGAMLYFLQSIFTLPDLSKMQVKMKIHESVIKKISPGLKATLQIDALPNQVLHGTVKTVGTLAQNDWRSGVKEYSVEVKIEDLPEDAGLKPGMTAEVKVHVKTLSDVLMAPVQAVTELEGKRVCYVVKGRAVERREVVAGESSEQFIEIKEGLQEGEALALDARARASAEAKKSAAQPGQK